MLIGVHVGGRHQCCACDFREFAEEIFWSMEDVKGYGCCFRRSKAQGEVSGEI